MGLSNDAATQLLTQLSFNGFVNVSDALIEAFFSGITTNADIRNKLACEEGFGLTNIDACMDAFSANLLQKAFRREINSDDISAISSIFNSVGNALEDGGLSSTNASARIQQLSAVMSYALLAPDFLLMVENGSEQLSNNGHKILTSSRELLLAELELTGAQLLLDALDDVIPDFL